MTVPYTLTELETALKQLNFLRDSLGSNHAKTIDMATYYIEKAIEEA